MNLPEIEKYIRQVIRQSLDNQEIENPKIDCKSKWYDLKSGSGIAEFVKDSSSIANTVGLDGFIIIGFNDKIKAFTNVNFQQSGLKDSSDLYYILLKHIDSAFEVNFYPIQYEGYYLNVLHIPPSLQKPHVIKLHQSYKNNELRKEELHRIFVRKNTATREASKYDIDLMYYDRKNIEPEHEIYVSIDLNSLKMELKPPSEIDGKYLNSAIEAVTYLTFENIGRRTIQLKGLEFDLMLNDNDHEFIHFRSTGLVNILDQRTLRTHDIIPLQWILESTLSKSIDMPAANNKMLEYTNNKTNLKLKNAIINTTNNYRIPANTN